VNNRRASLAIWILRTILLTSLVYTVPACAGTPVQKELSDHYFLDPEEGLDITVQIWGAVRRPGLYRVRDATNLLELISEAGGPTEYANLKSVKLIRARKRSPRLLVIDLTKYLDEEDCDILLPVLYPGDTVRITRNKWYTWRTAVRIASEIATIANLYLWFERLGTAG